MKHYVPKKFSNWAIKQGDKNDNTCTSGKAFLVKMSMAVAMSTSKAKMR